MIRNYKNFNNLKTRLSLKKYLHFWAQRGALSNDYLLDIAASNGHVDQEADEGLTNCLQFAEMQYNQ